jgi:excisionase family DNA binding protein
VGTTAAGTGELLTTGQVAGLLGASRQHVVDLCTRGDLPFVSVGTHRRVRRDDVEAFLGGRLTREAERSLCWLWLWLWLHCAVAGRLVLAPDTVMRTARANLTRMRTVHPDGMSGAWLAGCAGTLDRGVDATLDVLTSRAPRAVELRQNSPFAGVLTDDERGRAMTAFRTHWRRDHTAV